MAGRRAEGERHEREFFVEAVASIEELERWAFSVQAMHPMNDSRRVCASQHATSRTAREVPTSRLRVAPDPATGLLGLVGGGYRRRRCSLTRLTSTVRATVTILGPVDKPLTGPPRVSSITLRRPAVKAIGDFYERYSAGTARLLAGFV